MMPIALTIAGSDSSGGAGIQADLKTFSSLGVYGTTVVTAVTAQDSLEVHSVFVVPAFSVAAQFEAVVAFGPGAIKVGMLGSRPNVEVVTDLLQAHGVGAVVLDPVLASTAGTPLLEADALDALREGLLPQAFLVTPNMSEAAILTRREVRTVSQMGEAARALHGLGVPNVLVTGGHLSGAEAIDVFYDGEHAVDLRRPKIGSRPHGTGCVLSAAVAAYLARKVPIRTAIARATDFAARAIESSIDIGRGQVADPVRK